MKVKSVMPGCESDQFAYGSLAEDCMLNAGMKEVLLFNIIDAFQRSLSGCGKFFPSFNDGPVFIMSFLSPAAGVGCGQQGFGIDEKLLPLGQVDFRFHIGHMPEYFGQIPLIRRRFDLKGVFLNFLDPIIKDSRRGLQDDITDLRRIADRRGFRS